MLSREVKKDFLKIIIFTVLLVFAFINIKEIWTFIIYIWKIILPFLLGIVLAFILNILINFIEKKLLNNSQLKPFNKRIISLSLSMALIFTFIIFLFILIIPELKNTTTIFIDNIPYYEKNLKELSDSLNIDASIFIKIEQALENLEDTIVNYVKNNSKEVIEITWGVASNILSIVFNFIVSLVFAIYLLVQKEKLLGQLNRLMIAYLPNSKALKIKKIAALSNKICAKFVVGQCLEAFIIGFLCFLGMLILRLPYATTISVLIGVTALIPVFGAFIGTIIGAFLIFMIEPVDALIFVIFILLLQQFEGNLIYPRVVGKSVGLPGIWVFVAVSIGASVAGVLGMLISVPIVSICYSVLATNVDLRLKNKKTIQKNESVLK